MTSHSAIELHRNSRRRW